MSTSGARPRAKTAGAGAWFARWTSGLLDLLYPSTCALCGADIDDCGPMRRSQAPAAPEPADRPPRLGLCDGCRAGVVDREPACPRCGAPLPLADGQSLACPRCAQSKMRFNALVRLGRYEGLLREAVLRTKQVHGETLALALARTLAAERGGELAGLGIQFVAPAPMHWTRRLARGANGPESIARAVARELSAPLKARLLRRVRATRPQYDLTPPQRRQNVRGAFHARRARWLEGARVLLVDDVLTTGATANEATRALRRAGADFVAVAVLARTVES